MSFLCLIIFFGGGLALLLALSQFMTEKPGVRSRLLGIFFSGLAILLLQHFYFGGWLGREIRLGAQPVGIGVFLIGPSLYLYFRMVLERISSFNSVSLFHFLPALLSLVFKTALLLAEWHGISAEKGGMHAALKNVSVHLTIAGLMFMLLYLLLILFKLRVAHFLLRGGRCQLPKIVSRLVVAGIILLLAASGSLLSGYATVYRGAIALVSLYICAWFLAGRKYPELMSWVSRGIRAERYSRSMLHGIDTCALTARLDELMGDERLYCDEDLTLGTLARHLEITPHQLSEFLNSRFNINFKGYINQLRVEEVKKLLVDEPGRSIASIAFAAGFNTMSRFYDVFVKMTGTTPLEFRKQSRHTRTSNN